MIRNKNFKIIDDFLLECPEISQEEREEIIESIKWEDEKNGN